MLFLSKPSTISNWKLSKINLTIFENSIPLNHKKCSELSLSNHTFYNDFLLYIHTFYNELCEFGL